MMRMSTPCGSNGMRRFSASFHVRAGDDDLMLRPAHVAILHSQHLALAATRLAQHRLAGDGGGCAFKDSTRKAI
jgi:hypothetical protein